MSISSAVGGVTSRPWLLFLLGGIAFLFILPRIL